MTNSNQTLFGVNLSGLEDDAGFDDPTPIYPGVAGTNYGVPTDAEISYYASQGMNVIRLPFSWERMQPTLNGPLNSAYLAIVQGLVNYAATLGVTVIIDCHNYGYYDLNGVETQIGTGAVTTAAFADFWQQMATAFVNSPNVIFDLMNEPQFTTTGADATAAETQLWIGAQVAAIAAIRGTGATQEILISKPNTDHAVDFMGSNFELQLTQLMGTSGSPFSYSNIVLEFHQYFDANNSGDYTGPITNPNIGAQDLQAATTWARQYGVRLFLGETDFPTDTQSQLAEANLIIFLQQNSDVWQGATLWGGGPAGWNPVWNASGSDGLGTDPGLNNATSPMIATFDASTEPSILFKYFFGSNTNYTAAASSNTAYYGNNNVIGAPSSASVLVSGNSNTINVSSSDQLVVSGSTDTVNASGSADKI